VVDGKLIHQGDSKRSPYIKLERFLKQWTNEHPTYYASDLIVRIWTDVLGYDTILAFRDPDAEAYEYNTDWYEGGDVVVVGITPCEDLTEMKYSFTEVFDGV